MDIRKPKPIHNLREFLKEVGIIVLGVCIALSAEQAVEWWHWRSQVAEARQVIAAELAGSMQGAITSQRTENCTERRLDQLAAILDTAAKSGSLPPVGDIGFPPRSLWADGAWQSVVASQTATHFPRQQLADISGTYEMISVISTFNLREIDDWRDLYAMVGPGRRLDPPSEAVLRQALSHARNDTRALSSLSALMMERVKNLGISFSRRDLDAITEAEQRPLTSVTPNGIPMAQLCGPIGAVPAAYGQATLGDVRTRNGAATRKWPDFSHGAQ